MGEIVRAGLDIAKEVFQVHGVDANGEVVSRRKLRRGELLAYFKKLDPCLIGIESCATSHHWARALSKLGHKVKLVSPSFVKPFVKSQKNDAADAEAICEAIARPGMRFVSIKSEAQQAILTIHRARDLFSRQRTMLINALRAHIAEYGHVARLGELGLKSLLELVETDERDLLPEVARDALVTIAAQIRALGDKIAALERKIEAWHRASPESIRLATIPGIGALAASALTATVPDPRIFRSGRGLAAWLGLVPKQYSSGGTTKLGRITKRGNRYLRRLLVFGARNVLVAFKSGRTRVPRKIAELLSRKPLLVAAVAFANKLARAAWALLTKCEQYRDPSAVAYGEV
jgi:transposase